MKAVIFEEKIVTLWTNGQGQATVSNNTFGHRGPFPDGVTVVDVEDIETESPEGLHVSSWSEPKLENGKVTRSQVWEPVIQTAQEKHSGRLAVGIEWKGERYPCLKKDRDGINSVIAGFDTSAKLFTRWIETNGPPQNEDEVTAMVVSGAVPPEARITSFQWSDGQFLTLNEEDALAVAGKMSIVVSRSFKQLELES